MHQSSLASVPYSPVLHDLSTEPRTQTAVEMSQEFTDMVSCTHTAQHYHHTYYVYLD